MEGRENKPHIGIFGRRNFGKSSIINAITGQNVAIVSELPGTTTDPVKKSIEIQNIGPVIIIDTAGIDDKGKLGSLRVEKTKEVLKIVDFALLILNNNEFDEFEEEMIENFYDAGIPYIFVHNKSDIIPLSSEFEKFLTDKYHASVIDFCSIKADKLNSLVSLIARDMPETAYKKQSLIGDLVQYGDIVLLITPIDTEAPEGRLILPQVQAIRDILDNDCIAIILKERELDSFLKNTRVKPKLAVCDTSVILKANASVPKDIPLTGFSILLARFKGEFDKYLEGTPAIDELKDNDCVLMLESCTHHVSCDDIGRVKLPRWMSSYTGKKLQFDIVSGLNHISRPITDYSLIIQCGGCMITRKQIVNRLKPAIDAGIPVTNYGMAIAWIQGVYERTIKPFVKGDDL